ncbi:MULTISPECIES: DUF3325 domain-containing protein [unclassified Herbaspirillum]|uniref:DUF3325 domain-containing protein n=1 Tax=unclassified Herbaspirillum TaxID=2624150 RepID=UPI00114F50F8|nr:MULTISPECIES: DUF3325 domain-containing protein [unclassified Herbaspirillum]MBB5391984.1 dolichyl-phosphate-mannose--protein O-mannosyl transferase [Herbaspirillum sp. SJZ102]TQK13444.1 uncharacterized protein DUF3325 [Herbaspirillum sp. SJZ130]TQK15448.1 uncharacterized protein DUF3325 [Herbaspirillum sp. SJZ106]TWC71343.1 uncharacterized protein DUF3325 [Herbaspirillum sp. SJZ099]
MNPFGVALAMALGYCAWSALSMAMDRHYADIHGRGAEPGVAQRRRLRWLGALGIALTCAVAVAMLGWTIGPVGCIGFLSMAGVLQVLSLTYAPARVPVFSRWLAYAAPVLAGLWLL